MKTWFLHTCKLSGLTTIYFLKHCIPLIFLVLDFVYNSNNNTCFTSLLYVKCYTISHLILMTMQNKYYHLHFIDREIQRHILMPKVNGSQ